MNKIIDELEWIPFLKEYSAKNEERPTRLGVFEPGNGGVEDLWIEDGLPLIAVDAYENKGAMRIDIVLRDYVHPVDGVVKVMHATDDGDGLDIQESSGRTTLLRFEDWK